MHPCLRKGDPIPVDPGVHGTIHKQVTFPSSSKRLQREPERNRKINPFFRLAQPYPETLLRIHLLRSDQDRSGDRLPRRLVWQPGGILQTLFGSPVQRPMPNQRCQTIIAH